MNEYKLELFSPTTSTELAAGIGGLAFALEHYERCGKSIVGGSVEIKAEELVFHWEEERTEEFFESIVEFLHYTVQDNGTSSGLLEWAPILDSGQQDLENRLRFQRALEKTLHINPRHDRKYNSKVSKSLFSDEELLELGLNKKQNKSWQIFEELPAKSKVIESFRSAIRRHKDKLEWERLKREHLASQQEENARREANGKKPKKIKPYKRFKTKGSHWTEARGYSSSLIPNCSQLYAPIKGDNKNIVKANAFEALAYLFIALGAYPFVVAPNHGALVVPAVLNLSDFVVARRRAVDQTNRINYQAKTVEDAMMRVALVLHEANPIWEMPVYSALYLSGGNTMNRTESLRASNARKEEMVLRYKRIAGVRDWLRSLAARDIVAGRRLYQQIGERIVCRGGIFAVREDRAPKEKARAIASKNKNPEKRLMMEAIEQEMTKEERALRDYVSACIRRAYGRGYGKGKDSGAGSGYATKNRDAMYRQIHRAASKQSFVRAMADIANGDSILPASEQGILWNFLNSDWKRAKSLAVFCFAFYQSKDSGEMKEETESAEVEIEA